MALINDWGRGTVSVGLNHSTMALLSEKLPNTCGSTMIYGIELSNFQVAGGAGYLSY